MKDAVSYPLLPTLVANRHVVAVRPSYSADGSLRISVRAVEILHDKQ